MNARHGSGDEREEGEIVDEFEDIISSDEELTMRQRIQELEAKNAELEKIANISGVYGSGNYDYSRKDTHSGDRYPLVSISISDDEEFPPAPPMGRIIKRRKSQQHSDVRRSIVLNSTRSNQRRTRKQSSSSPPPAPLYRASDKLLLSMFHDRVVAHSSLHTSSHTSRRKRKSKKSHSTRSRKTREYYINDNEDPYNFDTYNVDLDVAYENFNASDDERTFPVNREELRVALARNSHRNEQHVSLKDRLIRRKENTDTLNETIAEDPLNGDMKGNKVMENCDGLCEDKVDTEDDLEEQELRIIALKSAMIRKHMDRKKRNENVAYSPSDFDEVYANIAVSPSINHLDVADACNSMEISPVPSPKMILSDDDGMDTKPVDMDIVNSESDSELPLYDKWVPIEQIPLPGNMAIDGMLYTPMPLRYDNGGSEVLMPPEVRFENELTSPINMDSELDEEEEALRALLLAKMNSPKVNKLVKEEPSKDPDVSLEAESLRNFLINNMKKKMEPQQSSPARVLKEAVRRLKGRNTSKSPLDSAVEIAGNNIKVEINEMEFMKPEETDSKPFVEVIPNALPTFRLDEMETSVFGKVVVKTEASERPRNVEEHMEIVHNSIRIEASMPLAVPKVEKTNAVEKVVNKNAVKAANGNKVVSPAKKVPPPVIAQKSSIESSSSNLAPSKLLPETKNTQAVEPKSSKPPGPLKQGPAESQEGPPKSIQTVASIKTVKSEKVTPKPVPKKPPQIPFSPSSSAQPAAQNCNKIVKPNKIINQQVVLAKRESSEPIKAAVPIKKMKIEDPPSSNRLITAVDMPPVNKLIIELRASDSESESFAGDSDDAGMDDDSYSTGILNRNIIAGNEYYDIDSPISLPMESPCDTPTGVASPAPTPQPIVAKSIVNDFFEAKLDQFLKTVRSKVSVPASPVVTNDLTVSSSVINTPVAVRHLPEASQQEYRRLINRMKLLERQKQAKNLEITVKTTTTSSDDLPAATTDNKECTTATRLVVVKSTTKNATPIVKDDVTKPNSTQKVTQTKSKANLLQLYESSYRKAGTTIISSLDENLKLVQEAKKAKMAKLKCQHRLKELRKEMDEIQKNLKEQQERITKTYPAIRNSHRVIETLKVKRGKINRTLMSLGRNVVGPTYSIKDEQKSVILEKSRKLAAEIKLVNMMKLSDIARWENTIPTTTKTKECSVQNIPNTQHTLNGIPSSSSFSKDLSSSSTQTISNQDQMPVSDSQMPQSPNAINQSETCDDTILKSAMRQVNEMRVPETETVLRDESDSTHGHEEALEADDKLMIGKENGDNAADDGAVESETEKDEELGQIEVDTGEDEEDKDVGGAKFQDYVSPLSHLRDERQINPNGIVCPYQLMGQCDDKDCKYMHLDDEDDGDGQ